MLYTERERKRERLRLIRTASFHGQSDSTPVLSPLSPPSSPPQKGSNDAMPSDDTITHLQKKQIHSVNIIREINRFIKLKRKTSRVPQWEHEEGFANKLMWRLKKKKGLIITRSERQQAQSLTQRRERITPLCCLQRWRVWGGGGRYEIHLVRPHDAYRLLNGKFYTVAAVSSM